MNTKRIISNIVEDYKKQFGRVASYVDLDDMVEAYLTAALWAETDDNGQPFDKNYSMKDISEEFHNKSKRDCQTFINEINNKLEDTDFDSEELGHDFWLTRNRHGAGFWDGNYPKSIEEILMKICRRYSEVNLYLGDDGKIYGL